MLLKCPNCNHDFERHISMALEKEHRITMTLVSENDAFGAENAAEALLALAKSLKASANAMGYRCEVVLLASVVDGKSLSFEVGIVPVKEAATT